MLTKLLPIWATATSLNISVRVTSEMSGYRSITLQGFTSTRDDEAEPLLNRALRTREKAFGPDHPDVGVSHNNLAMSHHLVFANRLLTNLKTRYKSG